MVDTLLAVLIPKLLEKFSNRATETVSAKNARFLHAIEKWFNGLAELRRYQNKGILKKIIGQKSRQLENSEYQRDKTLAYAAMVAAIFNIAGRVGVPLIAGILFFNHQVNLGVILIAGYFANGIFYSVDSCVNKYVQLKSTKTLRNRLKELQEVLPDKKYDDLGEVDSIQAKDLTVQYQAGKKIDYPDFTLHQGDKVLHPDLRKLGYLAQDLLIFPGSITDNITMFHSKFNARVNDLVEQIAFKNDQARFNDGLNTRLDPHYEFLSSGQQQKVILMRLMLHQTPILYLDEATSAIDQKATTLILHNLLQTQTTVLMIAHNLTPEQKALFDREIHLEEK